MKRILAVLATLAFLAGVAFAADDQLTKAPPGGTSFGQSTSDKISFYNVTPVVQPSGSTQTAITDSSGGTASAASGVSANAQKSTVIIPLGSLSLLANSSTWKIALPYAFQVTAANFRTGNPVSTGSKLASLSTSINGVLVTGGTIQVTSAAATPTGALISGAAITGANTGTAGQTLEVQVSGVTAFAEGSGWVEFTVVNTDKANESATFAALSNAVRSALVTLGLIKGSS